MPQPCRRLEWVVGENAIDPDTRSVLPVLRNISTDRCTSNKRSLPGTADGFHLFLGAATLISAQIGGSER